VTALDQALPRWERRERHGRRIDAPPEAVWAALVALKAEDVPVTRLLFRLRGVVGGGPDPRIPLVEAMPLTRLAADEPRELVLGMVGKFWGSSAPAHPPADLAAYAAFDEPGWAKAAMNFTLTPERGGTRLDTETRVATTDERMRRLVGLYWMGIRAGSGLMRHDLLRGIDKAATA
jgi:uncharacterized protein YndB with AHSA1/START domain